MPIRIDANSRKSIGMPNTDGRFPGAADWAWAGIAARAAAAAKHRMEVTRAVLEACMFSPFLLSGKGSTAYLRIRPSGGVSAAG